MAGEIKRLLNQIIEQRAKGNPLLVQTTQAKLIFKGVDPERFNHQSPDDAAMISRVKAIAAEFGIKL